jgi:hypothetical protein
MQASSIHPTPDEEEAKKAANQSALEAAGDAYRAVKDENIKIREAALKRSSVDFHSPAHRGHRGVRPHGNPRRL